MLLRYFTLLVSCPLQCNLLTAFARNMRSKILLLYHVILIDRTAFVRICWLSICTWALSLSNESLFIKCIILLIFATDLWRQTISTSHFTTHYLIQYQALCLSQLPVLITPRFIATDVFQLETPCCARGYSQHNVVLTNLKYILQSNIRFIFFRRPNWFYFL